MDITPQLHESAPLISRYGNGAFIIGSARAEGSVFVTRQQHYTLDTQTIGAIHPEDVLKLMDSEVEILLIGTGAQHQMLPQALRQALEEKGINYDSMDTGAACRTFNILLAEDRRVAALLIAV